MSAKPEIIHTDLVEERRLFMAQAHTRSQRRTTFFVLPAIVLSINSFAFVFGGWQLWLLAALSFLVMGVVVYSYKLSQSEQFQKASLVTLMAVIGYTSVGCFLVEGISLIVLTAMIASIVHASVYTRQSLYVGFAIAILATGGSEIAHYYELSPAVHPRGLALLWVRVAIFSMLMVQTGTYLLQANKLNRFLITRLEGFSAGQTQVISTVHAMQPVINGAVDRIREISNAFATQASEQATATTQVSSTVMEVMQTTEQTARAAGRTQQIAETTREGLEENRRQFGNVERGFEEVVARIEGARGQVVDLSSQVEKIEEILAANRAIGEHIKVLAVNAAIEAAKAGEYGKGFHVVASELREMIHSTDENLSSSHQLLEQIRSGSRDASESIAAGSGELAKYFEALRETGSTIEKTVASFIETSTNVRLIAHASEEQQAGMTEMTATIVQLETAAGQLSESATNLEIAVHSIVTSHDVLRETLGAA